VVIVSRAVTVAGAVVSRAVTVAGVVAEATAVAAVEAEAAVKVRD
jgi:hypothetical protein